MNFWIRSSGLLSLNVVFLVLNQKKKSSERNHQGVCYEVVNSEGSRWKEYFYTLLLPLLQASPNPKKKKKKSNSYNTLPAKSPSPFENPFYTSLRARFLLLLQPSHGVQETIQVRLCSHQSVQRFLETLSPPPPPSSSSRYLRLCSLLLHIIHALLSHLLLLSSPPKFFNPRKRHHSWPTTTVSSSFPVPLSSPLLRHRSSGSCVLSDFDFFQIGEKSLNLLCVDLILSGESLNLLCV